MVSYLKCEEKSSLWMEMKQWQREHEQRQRAENDSRRDEMPANLDRVRGIDQPNPEWSSLYISQLCGCVRILGLR